MNQKIKEVDTRINRLEESIDYCLEDIIECRTRIIELQRERMVLFNTPMAAWVITPEVLNPTPSPVTLRQTIRRSVCAEPGDYKTIAERLGITLKQASAQLSRLHSRGDISKSGSIYGTPGYYDPTVAGRA